MIARYKIFVLITLWAGAIGFGVHALMTYKGTPGEAGLPPSTWPANDSLAAPSSKPVVVMFAHPKCPCTRASLGELEQLAARAKNKFEAAVLFYQPTSEAEDWSESANVKAARSISNVLVLKDHDGRIAQQFRAMTSGHTVVYSQHGRLLFSGGITGSRGHIGDNAGFDSVLKMINNESVSFPLRTAKVFGCGLFDSCESNLTAEAN